MWFQSLPLICPPPGVRGGSANTSFAAGAPAAPPPHAGPDGRHLSTMTVVWHALTFKQAAVAWLRTNPSGDHSYSCKLGSPPHSVMVTTRESPPPAFTAADEYTEE